MGYLRRLPRFEYLAPRSVDEVRSSLAHHGGDARILAGGTDLLLQMRRREVVPRCVLGLKNVPELAFIHSRDNALALGAMTTLSAIESSPLISQQYDFLAHTAAEMGSPEIRLVATIGGNLSGALPCSDLAPPLLVLEAAVKLLSLRGERSVALGDFFRAPGQTVLEPDELLEEIRLPPRPPLSGGAYLKFHDRHAMDMTIAGVAAFVVLQPASELVQDARIALATGGPVPLRVKKAEAVLRGQPLTKEALEKAAETACEEARPRTSWRASREFRLELIRVLTRRAVRQAWEKARRAGPEL
ncbi:MAG: FAD binding domain-containing protein [Chloroflexi bacterium]|nr:FAD binding domain-containing protein [Chloroflexota bacterium]